MRVNRFFGELKRRHVVRVIGYYAVAAWVSVEVYTTIQPIMLPSHEWTNRLVVVLALLGFPTAFALAWIFDITPHGVRRTAALTPEAAPAPGIAAPRAPYRLSQRATGFFGLGILVAIVSLAAYAGFQRGEHGPAPEIQSIAVLPFADMSPNADQEFLSDGIAEELLNRLTQVPDLRVPARTSSFKFRGDTIDIREIARQLNVQAVLEGSIRRDGDRVRVTAQLINATTGYHIWSGNFDGDATSIFDLQDQIASEIVDKLRLHIEPAAAAGARGSSNEHATELYYRGMKHWNERTVGGLQQALADFQDALRADSTFALAWAALAQTYAVLPAYDAYPPDSAIALGMAAASTALRLDPSLAPAYAAIGQLVQNVEWDARGAEEYYRRALSFEPNHATARVWYAETLMLLGEFAAAAEHVAAALAVDPLSPVSLHADALLKTMRGATDEGLAAWRNLTRTSPDFPVAFRHHAYAAFAAGRIDEGLRSLQRLADARGPHAALYGALVTAVQDRSAAPAALAALRRAELKPSERAAWAMVLGDRDLALNTLSAGVQEHRDLSVPFLLRHPLFAPLRTHPKFPTLP